MQQLVGKKSSCNYIFMQKLTRNIIINCLVSFTPGLNLLFISMHRFSIFEFLHFLNYIYSKLSQTGPIEFTHLCLIFSIGFRSSGGVSNSGMTLQNNYFPAKVNTFKFKRTVENFSNSTLCYEEYSIVFRNISTGITQKLITSYYNPQETNHVKHEHLLKLFSKHHQFASVAE